MIEKLYTVEEVAALASVTGRTIRNYLKSGRLIGRKIGGQWRFPESEVQRLLSGAIGEEEALAQQSKATGSAPSEKRQPAGMFPAEPLVADPAVSSYNSLKTPEREDSPLQAPEEVFAEPAAVEEAPIFSAAPNTQAFTPQGPDLQQAVSFSPPVGGGPQPVPQQAERYQPSQGAAVAPPPSSTSAQQPVSQPNPYGQPRYVQPQPLYQPTAPAYGQQPPAEHTGAFTENGYSRPAAVYAGEPPLPSTPYSSAAPYPPEPSGQVATVYGAVQPPPEAGTQPFSGGDNFADLGTQPYQEPAPLREAPHAKTPEEEALQELSDVGKRVLHFASEVHDCADGPQICSVIDLHQTLDSAQITSERIAEIARQESERGAACQSFVEYDARYYVARYTLFGTSTFLSRCLLLIG